jgi:hypothetical protein
MSSLSSNGKLRRKLRLKQYLEELSVLTARTVHADELGSLEHAAAMQSSAQKYNVEPDVVVYRTRFADKSSEQFKKFIRGLRDANSSAIYVWTPRTIDCGAFLVPSLDDVNFDFDFNINSEGILVFVTSDLEDRLTLDFSATSNGEHVLRIETQGMNWPKVRYRASGGVVGLFPRFGE